MSYLLRRSHTRSSSLGWNGWRRRISIQSSFIIKPQPGELTTRSMDFWMIGVCGVLSRVSWIESWLYIFDPHEDTVRCVLRSMQLRLSLRFREFLDASFSVEDIRNALFDIALSKALGPDGPPVGFF
ncbi:hypothetical protein Ddye_009643 [Dipteronia dyeriana]|uniref:Uncharacterized protein n=1 Tax=Dipteronia dyeriana TaxID=168575 RepID=A0AAE0CMI6_9ROSI|nr:hypothetical protein Ddye_009643 [Dipteronia dyeriana]